MQIDAVTPHSRTVESNQRSIVSVHVMSPAPTDELLYTLWSPRSLTIWQTAILKLILAFSR